MKYTKLKNWIKQDSGSDLTKFELKFYEANHRGIIAAKDVTVGENMLVVPFTKLLSNLKLKNTPIYHQMKQHGLLEEGKIIHLESAQLAIVLLLEK